MKLPMATPMSEKKPDTENNEADSQGVIFTPATMDLLNAAHAIYEKDAVEAGDLGFMGRAFITSALPHSKVSGNEFIRTNGAFTTTILAPSTVGLPYGSIPRLLLAWISREVVRTNERHLPLGESLSDFMRQLGMVPTGGRWGSIGRLRDQIERLFSSFIVVNRFDTRKAKNLNTKVADEWSHWWDTAPEQTSVFPSDVRISEQLFDEIMHSPVPIDMRALRALKKSPMALDIYCWSTYRVSYLRRETEIPWALLQLQFGGNYKREIDFKRKFLDGLKKVELVYPELKFQVGDRGLILKKSRPHIPKILIAK